MSFVAAGIAGFLAVAPVAVAQNLPARTAPAQPTPTRAAPAIEIIDRPISFSAKRESAMIGYMAEHYGLTLDNLEFIPRMIVLHWTDTGSFAETFRTFNTETTTRADISGASDVNVSIQFVVDRDGTIYRLMPENWMARHVIGLNHVSIGVENVGTGNGTRDNLTEAQVEANARLIRYLVAKYPTIRYVIGHHEYRRFEGHPLWGELNASYRTVKIDPGARFMGAVRERIEGLGVEGAPIGATSVRNTQTRTPPRR
jgi:beta-N-acetylhexosaminidase